MSSPSPWLPWACCGWLSSSLDGSGRDRTTMRLTSWLKRSSSILRPRRTDAVRPFLLARGVIATGVMVCLALIGGCQVLNRSTAAQGIQGRITWPKDGDLWVYDVSSKQQTKITNLASGAAVTGATWSPD